MQGKTSIKRIEVFFCRFSNMLEGTEYSWDVWSMAWQNSIKPEHDRNRKKENNGLYRQLKEQERRDKQERLRFLEVLSESICLPPDVLAGAPIVTMHGRNAIYIENHKKITEYSEEHILIQTKSCKLAIEGKSLKIDYFTKEELKISGLIRRVSYGEEAM